jgi:CheY-like chemotaxis protein
MSSENNQLILSSLLAKRSCDLVDEEGVTLCDEEERDYGPRGHKELRDFTLQQYDKQAFEMDESEQEWTVLKMSKELKSFYGALDRNRSEIQRPRFNYSYSGLKFLGSGNATQTITSPTTPVIRGVLVVEDSITQRKLICRSLTKLGLRMNEKWVFFEASSGELALKMWEGLPIDLVFVDQNLSSDGFTGDEIIKIMRKSNNSSKSKKILMVGIISNPQKHTAILVSAGADLVYSKPLSVEDAAIRSLTGAIQNLSV